MKKNDIDLDQQLSKRERQIMDALFEAGELSAQDVKAAIPDAPSYSAVRALLAKLVEKGIVQYRDEAGRYIYFPVIEQDQARTSALQKIVKTFFGGSATATVNALLGMQNKPLSADEIAELEAIIAKAKHEQE